MLQTGIPLTGAPRKQVFLTDLGPVPFRVGILASGNGSNAEALIQALGPDPGFALVGLASNNPTAGALARAAHHGLETRVLAPHEWQDGAAMLAALAPWRLDLILLAGYLKHIPTEVVAAYRDRILNIHPSLLPRHGGPGMYGLRVHQAVLAAGDSQTGPTVHLVNEQYDQGRVLAQRAISTAGYTTPESLQTAVLAVEHSLYPEAVRQYARLLDKVDA
jgi:phosphoribosylglycinamide formyltransferase-1